MFLKPTASVPSTVHEDKVPLDGVPSAGVVSVGEVRVLLVSVVVLVAVTRFVGVMIDDRFAISYSGLGYLALTARQASMYVCTCAVSPFTIPSM